MTYLVDSVITSFKINGYDVSVSDGDKDKFGSFQFRYIPGDVKAVPRLPDGLKFKRKILEKIFISNIIHSYVKDGTETNLEEFLTDLRELINNIDIFEIKQSVPSLLAIFYSVIINTVKVDTFIDIDIYAYKLWSNNIINDRVFDTIIRVLHKQDFVGYPTKLKWFRNECMRLIVNFSSKDICDIIELLEYKKLDGKYIEPLARIVKNM